MDERLDRAGQAGLRRRAGIEEQLEQEQRIAFGALDAARDQRRRHGRGERGQSLRILARQRAEVDAGERRAVQGGAPGARARIAREARRHHQQQRLLRGQHGEGGEALERPGVGPVDVFDHQQQRHRCADFGKMRKGREAILFRGPPCSSPRRARATRPGRHRAGRTGRGGVPGPSVGPGWPARSPSVASPRRRRRRRRACCARGCGPRRARSPHRSRAPARRGTRSRDRVRSRRTRRPGASCRRRGRRAR